MYHSSSCGRQEGFQAIKHFCDILFKWRNDWLTSRQTSQTDEMKLKWLIQFSIFSISVFFYSHMLWINMVLLFLEVFNTHCVFSLTLETNPMLRCWNCNLLGCLLIEVRGHGSVIWTGKPNHAEEHIVNKPLHTICKGVKSSTSMFGVCVCLCRCVCYYLCDHTHTSEDQHSQPDRDREVTEQVTIWYTLGHHSTCWKVTLALPTVHQPVVSAIRIHCCI